MKILFVYFLSIMAGLVQFQNDRYAAARERMVKNQLADRGISDNAVLTAMSKVERHLFVPEEYVNEAYNDYPLPIGYGQTISQPFIVAYMSEAVRAGRKMKALEIGTGSGYQAAVLAELVEEVFTIEIVPELAGESAERLEKMGYHNVHCRHGDGYLGWKEQAPFDIIVVTAAAEEIPQPLIDQLADNGRLIIPVGKQSAVQELILLTKRNGKVESKRLSLVRFVPFKRL